jgi:hypothetical protein
VVAAEMFKAAYLRGFECITPPLSGAIYAAGPAV